jgi:hypothetical protein
MNSNIEAKEIEDNFLSAIITSSIFFLAGISLTKFTDLGPVFSVVSLLAAFLLFVAIVTDYFSRRNALDSDQQKPRVLIDVLAYILIPVLVLIVWMIVVVWRSIDWKLVRNHLKC